MAKARRSTKKKAPTGKIAPREGRAHLTAEEKARQTALKATTRKSAVGRYDNLIAGTPNARIHGHASGSQRAAQGRRDVRQADTEE